MPLGRDEGINDGLPDELGTWLGCEVGQLETDGCREGCVLGLLDTDGISEGCVLGWDDGCDVGQSETDGR